MTNGSFPSLKLADWQPTRDALSSYAKVLGSVHRTLTPRQKHWWHIALHVHTTGITTTSIPGAADGGVFEVIMDLINHRINIATSAGATATIPITGQSVTALLRETVSVLAGLGIRPEMETAWFESDSSLVYDQAAVRQFHQVLVRIDAVLKEFKAGLRTEAGPVLLWPHHFDLALLWFSGRLVPDTDPNDEEHSDEQMNFGFSTGDEYIPDAYFYITAYPSPDGLAETPLSDGAYWYTEGTTMAVLPYSALVDTPDAHGTLLNYYQTVQRAGQSLLQSS
ncbi:hypothetical protein KFU94_07375 [Chloroflexi bacterium TSY]|nr:hypothetical protein [Chloroflexi bacterium TSY]